MWVSVQYHRGDFRIVSIVIINVIGSWKAATAGVARRLPSVMKTSNATTRLPRSHARPIRHCDELDALTCLLELEAVVQTWAYTPQRPDAYLFYRELSRENKCLIETEICSKIGIDMNTVSRFVIPNPKVCFINVRTCFASPYDMNCPLATRAHMQKMSYNTALLLMNTRVHPERVDQLVSAVVLGAVCWSSRRIKSHSRAFLRECDWTEIIMLTYIYKL